MREGSCKQGKSVVGLNSRDPERRDVSMHKTTSRSKEQGGPSVPWALAWDTEQAAVCLLFFPLWTLWFLKSVLWKVMFAK